MNNVHLRPSQVGGTCYCLHCRKAWNYGDEPPPCNDYGAPFWVVLLELLWPMVLGGVVGFFVGVMV